MKIPASLKIGGHTYNVISTADEQILEGALGCLDERAGAIYLDYRAPHSIQSSSLIHEIFHAMATTLDDEVLGHALIDALSEQFYQVLADNNLLK